MSVREAEPAPEQLTWEGLAFFRGGQSLKLSTKASVFKRVKLVDWGGQACRLGPPLTQALAVGLGFDSRAGQIDTVSPAARHRCEVSLELCCPGAKPWRLAPPLVTRFGVIPRV